MAVDPVTCSKCRDLDELFRCVADPSPSLNEFRRTFTALTMFAFANVGSSADYRGALECRAFSDDPQLSKIHVQAQSVIDPADTENIPGVLVSVKEGVQFKRMGFGDNMNEAYTMAHSTKGWLASADITFTCRDWDADVSCMEADYLMMVMSALKDRLHENWRWLQDYYPSAVTEPKMVRPDGDESGATRWYESTFVLHIDYIYSVSVVRESVPLRDGGIQPIPAGIATDVPSMAFVPFDGGPAHQ